jgi:hypothetical protein
MTDSDFTDDIHPTLPRRRYLTAAGVPGTAGPWTTVADTDGDLQSVTVELRDAAGTALDEATTSVSGNSASETTDLRSRNCPTTVALTLTDAANTTTTDTTPL